LYWDASAILSLLFADRHSETALAWMAGEATVHLLSTLAHAETVAVVSRLEREGAVTGAQGQSARQAFASWPWRRLTAQPDWATAATLAQGWPLRGADLWHLACARTLRQHLPELQVLTFDSRLRAACQGEGLIPLPGEETPCHEPPQG
jgi:predicted nucleic acid-binding protein